MADPPSLTTRTYILYTTEWDRVVCCMEYGNHGGHCFNEGGVPTALPTLCVLQLYGLNANTGNDCENNSG